MSKRKRTRLLLVGEFEGRGPDPLARALASLDAFRKALQPAGTPRVLFEDVGYHTTDLEEIVEALTHARIRPEQAGFWLLLRTHRAPLTPAQTERYGVEFITAPERFRTVRLRYPCPTAVDVGASVFGTQGALLFVDDEDGRAVAYAPPPLRANSRREQRQRGLCPVCGERVKLDGNTTAGRYLGTCGDAFTPRQWRTSGPRQHTPAPTEGES